MDSAISLHDGGYGGALVAVPLAAVAAIVGTDLALAEVTLLSWLALPPLLVAAGLFPGGLQLGFERLDPGLRGGT